MISDHNYIIKKNKRSIDEANFNGTDNGRMAK